MSPIKIRCLTPKCQWVGWMTNPGGNVTGQKPTGEWGLTHCPRCKGTYCRYA